MQTTVNRYSPAELDEFRVLIELKIEETQNQIFKLEDRMFELTGMEDDFGTDKMDDSTYSGDLEMMSNMIHRQKQHLRDLENALLRIKNKSYGICIVTGELIDKRRLLAVPTTTRSLAAKTEIPKVERKPILKTSSPTSFSRIIKKAKPVSPPIEESFFMDDEEEDEDDGLDYHDDNPVIDFDEIADPDTL